MHAIRVQEDGSLDWSPVRAPSPGPDEVVVDVAATAVNRADLLQRRGLYPPPDGASEILGLEAAGTIHRTGDAVDRWSEGDRVAALLAGGGYAERVAVPADLLLAVPDDLPLAEAAALPEVFYTAHLNLRLEANLSEGESVLVHAGASGVGTAAIQICALFDAPVHATASAPKLDFLREMGVRTAIDRHDEDFAERLNASNTEVDVVLDPVGGDYLERNIDVLADCGRLVVIGLLGGAEGQLPLADLLQRRLRVIGSVLRTRSHDEKVEITESFRREVWPHVGTGELEPIVYETVPIAEAERAHRLLEENRTVGKVVLVVDPQRADPPEQTLRDRRAFDF
ncbi:MAG: NAD(P)H-quinone oxidoreductase [Bradymonadaceae bacterium]